MQEPRSRKALLMEKKGTRLFQQSTFGQDQGWNIVELESRRQLRLQINELIQLTNNSTLNRSALREHLHQARERFSNTFITHLVRALHRNDPSERQAVIWLLTLLDDKETILPLQQLSRNERLPRSTRLAASFVLAGLGATQEVTEPTRTRLYAIS